MEFILAPPAEQLRSAGGVFVRACKYSDAADVVVDDSTVKLKSQHHQPAPFPDGRLVAFSHVDPLI